MPFSLFLAALVALPASAQEQQMAELGTCALESGEVLEDCRVGFHTVGQLNEDRDNTILIPSSDGGSSENLMELQAELPGEDHDYFAVAVDALRNGVSVSPSNSAAQALEGFPEITTRDMVRSQYRLATEVLGLDGVHAVMGVSMGEMQTFEWGVLYPDFMEKLVPIVGSPLLAGHDVALWETCQRVLRWGLEWDCDIVFANDCGHNIPGCEIFRARSLIRQFLRTPRGTAP